jgi:hypothetical protein
MNAGDVLALSGVPAETVGAEASQGSALVPTASNAPVPPASLSAFGDAVASVASPPLLVGLALAFVAVLLFAGVARHRRREQIALMQQGWVSSTVTFEDLPSLTDLIEVDEPRDTSTGEH